MKQQLRVGTWNVRVASEINSEHQSVFETTECDVWLLTEVNGSWLNEHGLLLGHQCVLSDQMEKPNHYWAAIVSKSPIEPLASPHGASCLARVGGHVFCSSVLPWQGAESAIWKGKTHVDQMHGVLKRLEPAFDNTDVIWGGDMNVSFIGADRRGSAGAIRRLHRFIRKHKLQIPTAGLMHQDGKYSSIDHIVLPQRWPVASVRSIPVGNLSDHDAYVAEFRTEGT